MAYRRFRQIGVDKVKMDFAFFAIAFNIKKMVAKMTKGGLFSYLRIYLNHITPYKLFTRLFFVEKKNSLYIHTRTYNEFLVIYIGSFDTPSILYSYLYPAINYYIVAKKTIEYLHNPKHFRTFAHAKEKQLVP